MITSAPLQIRNSRADAALHIAWDDGSTQVLPHRLLRGNCRCADCRMLRLRSQAALPVPEDIVLNEVQMVGQYGLQLFFSDGHQRGIYPWELLRELMPPR